MAENQTSSMVAVENKPVAAKKPNGPKKKRNKKIIKRIVTIVIIVVVLAAIGFGLWKLFAKKDEEQTPLTEFTYVGTISSTVTGSGVTRAADSATVSTSVNGKVNKVYVSNGDVVHKGEKLYSIDTAEADEVIKKSQDQLDTLYSSLSSLNGQISEINSQKGKLTVTAPFSGKLLDVNVTNGEMISEGQTLATIVNDKKMRVTQYFSYDYEGFIYSGLDVTVKFTGGQDDVTATIENVSMIERITDDGQRLFQASAVMDNPGTLTAGIEAEIMVPTYTNPEGVVEKYAKSYAPGTLEYYETRSVTAGATGTCSENNMRDYLLVSYGDTLVRLESDAYDEQISSINRQIVEVNKQIVAQQEVVAENKKLLDNYEAVAPIDGTVVSSTFVEGESVTAGSASITISNTDIIVLDAQIDEMDIGKVEVGMEVEVSQYDEAVFYGTITDISLEGKNDTGYAYFPATITIYNDGSLMAGMYCSYKLVASQIDDCIIAPLQSIKYTEEGTCLFIKADSRPANAVDLDDGIVPEGFYAVPVEVGLTDDYGAQIISGVDPDVEVFTDYLVDSAYMW